MMAEIGFIVINVSVAKQLRLSDPTDSESSKVS